MASRSLDMVLYDNFDDLRRAREEEDRRLIGQVDALEQSDTRKLIRYRRIIGAVEAQTRCDHILITLFNHQTHHRGQVHAALTQSDIEPPPLDVIYFLDELPEIANAES